MLHHSTQTSSRGPRAQGVHPHRAAGRHRHHRHTGGDPLPGLRAGARGRPPDACVNNLRQIGHGVRMYTQDYDERFPWAPSNLGGPTTTWYDLVEPYVKVGARGSATRRGAAAILRLPDLPIQPCRSSRAIPPRPFPRLPGTSGNELRRERLPDADGEQGCGPILVSRERADRPGEPGRARVRGAGDARNGHPSGRRRRRRDERLHRQRGERRAPYRASWEARASTVRRVSSTPEAASYLLADSHAKWFRGPASWRGAGGAVAYRKSLSPNGDRPGSGRTTMSPLGVLKLPCRGRSGGRCPPRTPPGPLARRGAAARHGKGGGVAQSPHSGEADPLPLHTAGQRDGALLRGSLQKELRDGGRGAGPAEDGRRAGGEAGPVCG